MPIEHINKTDTLNEGRVKLNNAITAFNETVVEGDSSVEAAQARVDEKGVPHPTLKVRIDDGFTKVASQLNDEVQQREKDISDINSNKASKTELQNGLESKVSKGENESVSWGMLDQSAKENISSGQVAVVGEDSVNRINLVDGAASFAKRTALGSMTIVQTGSNTPAPNIDTKNKKIKYHKGTYLSYGKYRYGLEEDVELDMISGAGAIMQNVFIDTSNNTLSILTGSSTVNQSKEDQLLVTSINWDSNQMEKLKQVVINGKYTVNDKNHLSQELNSYVNPTEMALILFGDPRKQAIYDLSNNKLTLPRPFYIHYKNNRYDMESGEDEIITLPTSRNYFVYFDKDSDEFKTFTSAQVKSGLSDNMILISSNFQGKVLMQSDFRILDGGGDHEKSGSYQIVDTEVSGLFDCTEIFSDFTNFANVKTDEVHNMFDNLLSSNQDILSKIHLGNELTGKPLNAYTLNVDLPNSDYYAKKPEVFINCGIHGYEHANTLVAYLMLKLILEKSHEYPHLELLKYNTKLTIVPVSNPSGFDSYIRHNSNGVDLNRNYPSSGWTLQDQSSNTYGGPSPGSELETQYIVDLINNNNFDLVFDFHNFGSVEPSEQFLWIPTGREREQRLALPLLSSLTRKWSKDFPFVDEKVFVGYTNKSLATGTLTEYARESNAYSSCTFEIRDRWVNDPAGGEYTQNVCKAGVEALVNWLVLNVKELVK